MGDRPAMFWVPRREPEPKELPMRCPWCGETTIIASAIAPDLSAKFVCCARRSCGAAGPRAPSDVGAVADWNRVCRSVAGEPDQAETPAPPKHVTREGE